MPHATDNPIDLWRKLLTNAHRRRIDSRQLDEPVKELAKRAKPSSDDIVRVVLGFRLGTTYDKDPLVIRYVEVLLRQRCISPSSLLIGMLQKFRFVNADATLNVTDPNFPSFEEKAFTLIRELMNDKLGSASVWKLHGLVFGVARWLSAITDYEMAQQLELGPLHTVTPTSVSMYEALGLLAYTVFGNQHFREVEHQPWWRTRRSVVAAELKKFDLNVLQWSNSQISGHLQALSRARPFLELDKKGLPVITREQILSVTQDLQVVRSRAGLFVWLTACLSARTFTDDSTMRNYLLVRYHEDAQNAALGLIMASFDVLANSAPGQGTPDIQKQVRSFICNRLPLVLVSLTTLMPTNGIDSCISMALVSVDLEPGALMGAGITDAKDLVNKTRIEFLQACILHSLLSQSSAASIFPDQLVSAPKAPRYNRSALLNQCTTNVTRLEALSQELDTMSGNVGAIAGCIADLILTLCNNKDTMTLKSVCSILLRRMPSFVYIFQYVAPATITVPICHTLNDWVHDQDQTEYQPPYEEFAVILLFLVAIVHGYDLTRADLGIADGDTFVSRALYSSVGNLAPSQMSDEQNKQLFSWIQGLYAADEHGETVGITDEVYSQCPPQAFYLLVPTLFEQTVLACKSKALAISTMKGGLEFLLEPFLLPSLIGGLKWVAETTWTDADDTNIRLQVLDKLLKSSSTSQEVQTMHKAILVIVANPLETSLRRLLRVRPDKKKDVTKLLDLVKPHLAQQHSGSSRSQLMAWSSSATGGLAASLGTAVSELAIWASGGGLGAPSKYSPHLVLGAEQVLGATGVLEAIVAALQHQISTGNGPVAIDVCTAIVCSSGSDLQTSMGTVDVNSIGLRDCLRLLVADELSLLTTDSKTAEAIVRLSRSVEAQSTISQLASQLDLVNLSMPSQETTEQVMQDLGLTTADASLDAATAAVIGAGLDASFNDNTFVLSGDAGLSLGKDSSAQDVVADANMIGLDQSHDIFGDLNIDLTGENGLLGSASAGNQIEPNPDDDIFGDLDMIGDSFDFM